MRRLLQIVTVQYGKEIKKNTFWKNIILKGNITTTYIEHRHKNTQTSVLTHPPNVEKQYH